MLLQLILIEFQLKSHTVQVFHKQSFSFKEIRFWVPAAVLKFLFVLYMQSKMTFHRQPALLQIKYIL